MRLILFIYLKTTSMKINWKRVALYVLRVIELIVSGAAGGAVVQFWILNFECWMVAFGNFEFWILNVELSALPMLNYSIRNFELFVDLCER